MVQSLQSIVKDCESTRYTSIYHKHHSMPCSAWARRWFWKTFPCKTWILRLSWAPLHLNMYVFQYIFLRGSLHFLVLLYWIEQNINTFANIFPYINLHKSKNVHFCSELLKESRCHILDITIIIAQTLFDCFIITKIKKQGSYS